MPSVLIFGGSGQLAQYITQQLVQKGYQVTSVIRREDHIPSLRSLGATPIVQSLETASVSDLAATIRTAAPDAVIFAAGAGLRGFENPNLSLAIDRDAAIRVFDAIVEAGGTKRLITVSTIDARNREKPAPEWYSDEQRKGSDELWGAVPVYMKAKFEADRELVEGNGMRGLEYTIVRSTWYRDGSGTGRVKVGRVGFERKVSREDVARVMVRCVEDEGTVGRVFEVEEGDEGIEEAVGRVVRERIDTFGEMYR